VVLDGTGSGLELGLFLGVGPVGGVKERIDALGFGDQGRVVELVVRDVQLAADVVPELVGLFWATALLVGRWLLARGRWAGGGAAGCDRGLVELLHKEGQVVVWSLWVGGSGRILGLSVVGFVDDNWRRRVGGGVLPAGGGLGRKVVGRESCQRTLGEVCLVQRWVRARSLIWAGDG